MCLLDSVARSLLYNYIMETLSTIHTRLEMKPDN